MVWPVFPVCPSFGFNKSADYSVSIVERSSGIRSVNRNWYYPLHQFSAVPIETRRDDDMSRVIRFWHAVGGRSGQFLFKDYTDYKSTVMPSDAITATDQPLEETTTANVFQLLKMYTDEEFNYQQLRIIQKPKQGSILISDNGTPLTEGGDYTIDYDTGLVTVTSPPAGVLTWGGEFYVPVMFESTPEFMIVNWRSQSTGFALRELRLTLPLFPDSSSS